MHKPAAGQIALACFFSLLLPTVSLRADVNLLANGSFERRNNGSIPVGWTNAYTSAAPFVVSGIATKSGDNVLRIVDGSSVQPSGILSDPIPVTPGKVCIASLMAMQTDTQFNVVIISIKFYDANGIELHSFSNTATGVANVWNDVSIIALAPSQAATARVLCASTAASTGIMCVDGVAFRVVASAPQNQLTKYVSPISLGSANGSSPANAARFNLNTFWNTVNSDLLTRPVKIVFLEGEYVIDVSTNRLLLTNIGNSSNRLTLEGERPWGTVFTRTDAASPGTIDAGAFTMVQLQRATNIVIRHLHWENDTAADGKQSAYSLVINSATTGAQTRDIAVEGCTFVGLSWNIYGALGIHHQQTHHVQVFHCEFITGGFSGGFHMIYNAYGASDLRFENNYFQDCSGSYLRLRAGCYNTVVRSNEFVSTSSFYNQPFLQLATFNNIRPGDETWGYNHTFAHNRFNYLASGQNVAMHLYHSGFDPYRAPGLLWDYLLTSAEAGVLTAGTAAERKSLIAKNFGFELRHAIHRFEQHASRLSRVQPEVGKPIQLYLHRWQRCDARLPKLRRERFLRHLRAHRAPAAGVSSFRIERKRSDAALAIHASGLDRAIQFNECRRPGSLVRPSRLGHSHEPDLAHRQCRQRFLSFANAITIQRYHLRGS